MLETVLLAVSYAAGAVFLGAIAYRALKIARLPLHLRWELYPVAHEKGRARYGGSYLEEPDWWSRPRQTSLAGELRVMIPEIVLLAGVWEHNRGQWLRSFPFHFGLYLLAGLIGLLLLGGIATAVGVEVSGAGSPLGRGLFVATAAVGWTGLGLCLLGAGALIVRRVFEADYREYTTMADYFNLAFFLATLVVALIAHAASDPQFALLRAHFARLVTVDVATATGATLPASALTAAEVVMGALLLAYIPLTHMSHFFTKWFMYHDIRWSDEPNVRGGRLEREVIEALQYPISWAAPHIRGDGRKTWLEVATTSGVEEEEEEEQR
jgi:nitrate reductase gamma subunit